MKTIFFCFYLFFCIFCYGQSRLKDRIAITISGHKSGDTLNLTDFIAHPFIAEAHNPFGFEIVPETDRIKFYSVTILSHDSTILQEQNVKGAYFTDKMKYIVTQKHNEFLKIVFYDIHMVDKKKTEWTEKESLLCFLK